MLAGGSYLDLSLIFDIHSNSPARVLHKVCGNLFNKENIVNFNASSYLHLDERIKLFGTNHISKNTSVSMTPRKSGNMLLKNSIKSFVPSSAVPFIRWLSQKSKQTKKAILTTQNIASLSYETRIPMTGQIATALHQSCPLSSSAFSLPLPLKCERSSRLAMSARLSVNLSSEMMNSTSSDHPTTAPSLQAIYTFS